MKIIHLISGGDVGGAKTHVHLLLKGLMKTEEVELVCFMEGPFAEEARALGIPTTVMTGNVLTVLKTLSVHIKSGGFQIIHCHGSRANMMGAILRDICKIPIITTVHSDYRLDYLGRPLGKLVYGTINAVSLRRFRYHIGVSDPIADMLVERGFDPAGMFSIYNGVDFTPMTPKMTRDEYLHSIGLNYAEDSVIFGIAARISPVKDIPTLIRAFSAAVSQIPSIRLVIAGDGEDMQKIKDLASETCPEGTVLFAGWVTDMDSYYNAIDVNVLTSLSETFPYALTEGARKHCATIATRVGGVPVLIEDGVSGLLLKPGDAETLASHMIRVASDKAFREELAENLYVKARDNFSVDATVNRQKEIYHTVLRREARPKGGRDGVLISGAYGLGNGGDGAILESMISRLREADADMPICVLSRNPKETSVDYRVRSVNSFNLFSFIPKMLRAKLYISGGGTLIQDVTSTRSLWYYLLNIRLAHVCGCKVMMYGCGLGPVTKPFNRRLAGKVINKSVDVITLRDEDSLRLIRRMRITKPKAEVTADPALLIPPASDSALRSYLAGEKLVENGNYMMFSVRDHENFENIASSVRACAEYFYRENGLTPVFFASNPVEDAAVLQKLTEGMRCPFRVVNESPSSVVIIRLTGMMKAVVSVRMHPLVFASMSAVPIVGIVYDPKVKAFLNRIPTSEAVSADAITADTLIEKVKAAMEKTPDTENIERLKALARRNGDIAEALIKE